MTHEFFKMLKKDHKAVKDILESLEETKETAPRKREDLFLRLREELVPHMKAEETTFYPVLLGKEETRKAAMEGVEEHHVSEMVLKELEKMPKSEEQWGAKMAVFKELVEHHIEEEESRLFKGAQKALDDDDIQEIMTNFDLEKKGIKTTLK